MAAEKKPEETYSSRTERERIGRQTNAGFARVERAETEGSSTNIPTGPIGSKLTEEEIRRRVGQGNFDSAKDDNQTSSINS
ncbi:hypothetical protein A1A1_09081 [Planococcus antarcticus DSM 14505]|uniref:Uncharacterized protein n=1 Tax=Planococcus antarcticus DSM 14505 TaxID=1185653 RepID=A0A1C7DHD8_9BACL|nr:hypothetical protein [Planococcus antarcticus]ANU10613.1 hypothetical protein BBH88_09975 [Planococcus antarcticus DSM 14505]EIM06696.1 hypothetical protein A1A1_09081 [Planococcus antarcticus DSM 14505]